MCVVVCAEPRGVLPQRATRVHSGTSALHAATSGLRPPRLQKLQQDALLPHYRELQPRPGYTHTHLHTHPYTHTRLQTTSSVKLRVKQKHSARFLKASLLLSCETKNEVFHQIMSLIMKTVFKQTCVNTLPAEFHQI